MLVVKYSKTDGAEFIPHLDTLRHLQKTIIRSKVPVGYSKGFNPHMLIFMSAPIGVGLTSTSEYFFLETDEAPESFIEKFNRYCPGGFKALFAAKVSKNPNLQAIIDSAQYFIECEIGEDTISKVLDSKEYRIIDKRGKEQETRGRILSLKKVDNGLIARLSFGNETLRADIFAQSLFEKYGVKCTDVIKKECFIKGEPADEYLSKHFAL